MMNSNEIATEEDQQEIEYISQFTPLQRRAYEIAKDHLKTSFDIRRSNGFIEWLNSKNIASNNSNK